jgi:site-specific recombinase XerD
MEQTPVLNLPDLLVSWEISLKAERRALNTIQSYTYGVRAYLRWCSDNMYPSQLTKELVRAWTAELLEDREPATARIRQRAVRSFSAWLTAEGEQAEDPLLGLRSPTLTAKVTRSLDDDECARLIKACSTSTWRGGEFTNRRDEAVVRLMLETGMRAGEVLGLAASDIDLGRGVLLVRQAKGSKQRIVPFGPSTARALDRYLRLRRSHALAGTPALWLGAMSRTLNYPGLRGALARRAEVAGLKGFHPHLMRHTAASRWLAAGGSEGGLMAVAGWTDRAMLDRYTRSTAAHRAVDEAHGLALGEF